MKNIKERDALRNLYGFMMEVNFNRSDSEILEDLKNNPDNDIIALMSDVKRKRAKLKSKHNALIFQSALNKLKEIREKGVEHIVGLFEPKEQLQYAPFFRKFEKISEEDMESLLHDQAFLELLNKIKDQDNL